MFAQVNEDFKERVREVDLYFQLLAALDNNEIEAVTGTSPQIVPVGQTPAEWGRMLKGAAYLVLYNLVEAFIRRGFQALFEAIQKDKLTGTDLTATLRTQWIVQRNRSHVKTHEGSPKIYMKIASSIIDDIMNNKVAHMDRNYLPFSGNLDADEIREVCFKHGISHDTPPAAMAGRELKNVMINRNALSHGSKSFAECGRDLAAADLIRVKEEIVLFVKAILNNLENFTVEKKYKAQV